MTTRKYMLAVLVAALLAAGYGVSANAAPGHGGGYHGGGWHGGGWHGGGWHGGGWSTHVYIGGPWYGGYFGGPGWWWGASSLWYPYAGLAYTYPGPYVAPAAVAPVQTAPAVQGPPPEQYWYYCRPANAYYPYVRQCGQAWERVPATPPAGAPSAN